MRADGRRPPSLLFDNGAIAHRQIAVRFFARRESTADGDDLAVFEVLSIGGTQFEEIAASQLSDTRRPIPSSPAWATTFFNS